MSDIRITKPRPEEKRPDDETRELSRKWLKESQWPMVDGKRVKPSVAVPAWKRRR